MPNNVKMSSYMEAAYMESVLSRCDLTNNVKTVILFIH